MDRKKKKVWQLIYAVDKEQDVLPFNGINTPMWWDRLSQDLKDRCSAMNWPPEDVARGYDRLVALATELGQI